MTELMFYTIIIIMNKTKKMKNKRNERNLPMREIARGTGEETQEDGDEHARRPLV